MKQLLAALALAVLLLPCLGGNTLVIRRGAAPAAAWQTPVTDDFERSSESLDASADWTEAVGDQSVVNNNEASFGSASGLAVWDSEGATLNALQCVCAEYNSSASNFCGPMLRVPALDGTGNSYAARWQQKTNVQVRECVGASCSDISGGTWSNAIDEDNWLCACVDGTQADTEFALWERASDPSAEDPTDWGTPDFCLCESGSCSLWASCDTTGSGEPGSGNYQDCGSGCYFGVYSGSAEICEFDNFSGRDYD